MMGIYTKKPAKSAPKPASRRAGAAEIAHVTEAMYERNVELAERNKTLSLLRKIDEIVLSAVTDPQLVAQQVADVIIEEAEFNFVAIWLSKRKRELHPLAIGYHPTAEISDEVRELLATKQLHFNEAAGPFSPAVKANRLARAKSLDELGTGLSPKMAAEVQRELRAACFHIAPLVARDELIGMMVIGSPIAASQLSDFQKNLLSQLKGAVAIAMDSTLLYAQLKEATAHLKEANQNLKELDKAKDDFISMASHQLRTPLTTIRGYLSMLAEGDAGAIAPQQKKFIDNALEGAFRMIGLIGELLNVSRLNTGRFTINRSACDVSALAADEVRRLQNFARERQLELKYVLPPTALPKAEIDEEKTRQVIMNFIDNALHYTPQGSVTVTLAATGHSVILKVTDTGIGVPKAARTKLFSKFYRAGNAMTARPDGTGLGLYVAKKVIEEQGGKILFDSTEGKGSMFGFELPLKAPQAK